MARKDRFLYVAVDCITQEVYIATTKSLCAKWLKIDPKTLDKWLVNGTGTKGRFIRREPINSVPKPWAIDNMKPRTL